MKKIEAYKGVDIAIGIVCYDIRYFVMNKMFIHFSTIEEAREDIDKSIYTELANEWIGKNKDYLGNIEFTDEDLVQIGKNISSLKTI